MRSLVVTGFALACLSACEMAAVPASQFGEAPQSASEFPVIGSVTGFVDGQARAWETIDFSQGAPDATAFILLRDAQYELNINAFPAGTGGQRAAWLQIKSDLPNGPVPGPGRNPTISLHDGDSLDGPRYQSVGAPLLNVSTLSRTDDLYGRTFGTFIATLCRVDDADSPPDPTNCLDIAGEFETSLQFDGF